MQRLTHQDFRVMPWKNGGGTTTELLHLQDDEEETLFRLSRAQVSQHGPFSILPGMERLLLVITGEGLQLELSGELLELRPGDPPLRFAGELSVYCDLIEGPVEDFNVMIDRNYGSADLTVHNQSFTASPRAYVYFPQRHELWVLSEEERVINLSDEMGIEVRVSVTDPH